MSNTNFHVYGTVTDIRTAQLRLNTGHWVLCPNMLNDTDITVGKGIFVQCYQTNTTSYDPTRAVIATKLKLIDNVSEFNAVNRELHSSLRQAVDAMKGLNDHDRAMVLTAIGIGAGALAAGSGLATLAGQAALIAAEGGFNPISVGIGGALFIGGTVSAYLQAERLNEMHGERIAKYNKFIRQQRVYASFMSRFFDTTAEMDSQPLNVGTGQVIQTVRDTYGYKVSQLSQWWFSTFDSYPSTYAYA